MEPYNIVYSQGMWWLGKLVDEFGTYEVVGPATGKEPYPFHYFPTSDDDRLITSWGNSVIKEYH